MPRTAIFNVAIFTGALIATVSTTACNRADEASPPVAEMQSASAPQATNAPVNVTGCLRAGEASGTFVLTTSDADAQGQTATYTLQMAQNAQQVNLQDHIGQRVQINGTLRSQQAVASTTPSTPAANAEPTGTAGTPTVQTRTEMDIKRLDVSSVRAVGGSCER